MQIRKWKTDKRIKTERITAVWHNSCFYISYTPIFRKENFILARNNRSTQPLLRQTAER